MNRFVAFSLAALFLSSSTAFAQGHSARTSNIPPPDREISFTDELVQGDLVRPELATVRGNRRRPGISLLRIREHFVQEMLKTVENF